MSNEDQVSVRRMAFTATNKMMLRPCVPTLYDCRTYPMQSREEELKKYFGSRSSQVSFHPCERMPPWSIALSKQWLVGRSASKRCNGITAQRVFDR